MGKPAVEVTDLVMKYGTKTAVDGLSLTVNDGGITAVLGPNGAGKTTTVETCEGYRRVQSGTVRVLGYDPMTEHRLLAPRIGVMLQSGGAWSGVRANEMLNYVASLYADPIPVPDLIDLLGIGSCGKTPYRRLSGGQQQRLSLAMALVGRPELVFLDEPTAGLDPQARHATWDLLRRLVYDGVTICLTTHDMEEAEELATDVYLVDGGQVVTAGTPQDLTSAGSHNTVRFHARRGLNVSSLRRALPAECTVSEAPPGLYRVDGEVSPDSLATLTAWCASQGIMPDGLAVERRTLEDVFLEITGRELRG